MSQSATERVRWTIADLDLLPDNGNRYEIIDGELFMTRVLDCGSPLAASSSLSTASHNPKADCNPTCR